MPVTRRRAAAALAAAAQVVVEEGRDAAIDISSDSDTAIDVSSNSDEEDSESEEEEDTSDEDFVDISDSEAGDAEGSGEDSEEESEAEAEAEPEHLGADRSEVACNKIAGLLRSGKSLEGLKLAECKAYLKKNGLSQTGGIDTCVDRMVLHWRFKDGDPERIYPRSSFCINCKGDVCRGDAVLFKQKVYEKSGKRHAKCLGKRIVAGKVIKESYGKQKQQHTFTIQVFWSKGAGKLPPLHMLLVKGRNLYRMMTFRQPWENEVERMKVLEEKHNRGDNARRVRALSRPISSGITLKGKKKLDKEKHKSRSGRPHCQSNITELDKGKKRPAQPSKFDPPNKRSKKGGLSQVPSGKETTGCRRAKKNRALQDKSICTGHNSSLCNDSREKNHATFQKNCHVPLNKGPSSSKAGMNKRTADSEWNRIGGTHSQLEGRYITPAAHVEANHGNFVLAQHPCVERPQRPTQLRELAHVLLPRPGGSHPDVPSKAAMGFRHPNGAMAGMHAPVHFRGLPSNQQRVAFSSPSMPQTVYHPHPEEAYVVPHFRYPRGNTGFRR